MKTRLPATIRTKREAKRFLKELAKNNEAFHPEDNAHDVVWNTVIPAPTFREKERLNKLRHELYGLENFDPCHYLLRYIDHYYNTTK